MRKISQVYYSRENEYYYVSKWLLRISASSMSENTRMEISVKFYELHELLTCISGKHTIMKSTDISALHQIGPGNSLPDTEDLTPFIFLYPPIFNEKWEKSYKPTLPLSPTIFKTEPKITFSDSDGSPL